MIASRLRPHRLCVAAAGLMIGADTTFRALPGPATDPFAFFLPWIAVTTEERTALDAGEVVARVLPSDDGHLAVFAATRIETSPSAFAIA